MIDFIPVELFKNIFFNFQLVIVLFLFLQSQNSDLDDKRNLNQMSTVGILLLFFIVTLVGFRPVSYAFGDMGTYSLQFDEFANNVAEPISTDYFFYYFMKFAANYLNKEIFFFLCMLVYTYSLYLASKKLFKEYWAYSFFILVFSLSFWAYGTNGIRNGMATSIFLLAITRQNNLSKILILIISLSIHQSMIIPVIMYVITTYYTNTRNIFRFWLLCIPLSLLLGSILETFFLGIGLGEDVKLKGYLIESEEYQEQMSAVGFRWDFLLYSIIGVFTGMYFIYKKNFKDKFYTHIFNVYLLTNAIWILVIRANFSNRFAYLSWFMLGLIIIYPFLKYKFFDNQHKMIGKILLSYFLITYFLEFVLS